MLVPISKRELSGDVVSVARAQVVPGDTDGRTSITMSARLWLENRSHSLTCDDVRVTIDDLATR
jgi:hypothetical protein